MERKPCDVVGRGRCSSSTSIAVVVRRIGVVVGSDGSMIDVECGRCQAMSLYGCLQASQAVVIPAMSRSCRYFEL